jgi:ABC-type multidrug transport system fused ATPase/permease subunit
MGGSSKLKWAGGPDRARLFLQRLRRLDARPTIVMIARRGESRALCNRVLHLAEGRLVAERERHKARA